ncbi:constitutive coactivator of peroxisome proliferator-activated receptor gamma-like [Branchiostoma lanceolatum]|uniref:constitutive coactivator of peroxisome proliferator-activated receptor gamma-like n=1 Tax=Branchiostoma lanceolatum TaxID=7740 RepID=UPI0034545292
MGVKGLQTYVEKNCPDAREKVNLRSLAQDYQAKHGKTPVLVVDGLSCLRDHFYHGGLAWVYGGQWQEYRASLRNFVQNFKSAGIEVVFIFDGVVEKSKRPVWISRRKTELKTVKKIFQYIRSTEKEPYRNLLRLPPGAGMFAGLGLKSLGVRVYHSLVEADREIAEFAFSSDCFGILSQDSDFLIYDMGAASYFSTQNLKRQKNNHITTVRYRVDVLCEHLGLEQSDLPLLACLLGNDVIPHAKLENFHARVSQGSPLIPALARFINGLPPDITVPDIARMISSSLTTVQLFVQAMLSYVLPGQTAKWPVPVSMITKEPALELEGTHAQLKGEERKNSKCPVKHVRPDIRAEILLEAKRRHQNTENIKAIYDILTVAEGDSGVYLEEEDSAIPPTTVFYRPIREKLHGVLYGVGVKPLTGTAPGVDLCSGQMSKLLISGEEIVVGRNAAKDWSAHPGAKLKEPDIILAKPLDMPGGTPTLEALWFGPGARNVALRWKAFMDGMFCSIPTERQKFIPKNLKVLVVILHYMVRQRVLEGWEADAFLIQALVCTDWHKLRRRKVPVDPRAVQLAALFVKGVAVAIAMNCACSWPLAMESCLPWWFFDGKYFHHVYLLVRSGAPVWDLCGRSESRWQLFQLMKDCVSCLGPDEFSRQSGERNSPSQIPGTFQQSGERREEAARPVSMGSSDCVSYSQPGDFWKRSGKTRQSETPTSLEQSINRTQKKTVGSVSMVTFDSVSLKRSGKIGGQTCKTDHGKSETPTQQAGNRLQKGATKPVSKVTFDVSARQKSLPGSAMSSEQSKKKKRNRKKREK